MSTISYDGTGEEHEWIVEPERVHRHVGHIIEVATYANQNLAIECVSCSEVLADIDYWSNEGSEEIPDNTARRNGPIVIGERCPWCGAMVDGPDHSMSHD